MSEIKAPSGAFLLVEMAPDATPEQTRAVFGIVARLLGVGAVCDLSLVPLALLEERVLLHLSPDEQRLFKGETNGRNGARRNARAAGAQPLPGTPERTPAGGGAPRTAVSRVQDRLV